MNHDNGEENWKGDRGHTRSYRRSAGNLVFLSEERENDRYARSL